MDDDSFREKLRGALKRNCDCVEHFLHICHYQSGQYDSIEDFARLNARLNDMEVTQCLRYVENGQERFVCSKNRLFYYAIPPSQFNPVSKCIHGSPVFSLCETQTPAWRTTATIELSSRSPSAATTTAAEN